MILVWLMKIIMISLRLIKMIMISVLLMKMRAEWWDHQSSQHPPLMNLQHILPLTTLCSVHTSLTTLCSVHITLNACSVHTSLNAMCSVHTSLTTLCVLLLTKVCTPLQALPFIVFLLTASHTHHPLPLNKLAHKTFFVTQLFCCTNAHFYHTSRISHTLIFTLDAAEKNHYHITNSILSSQFAVHLWRRPASNVAEKGDIWYLRDIYFWDDLGLIGTWCTWGTWGWYMEYVRYMRLVHGVWAHLWGTRVVLSGWKSFGLELSQIATLLVAYATCSSFPLWFERIPEAFGILKMFYILRRLFVSLGRRTMEMEKGDASKGWRVLPLASQFSLILHNL